MNFFTILLIILLTPFMIYGIIRILIKIAECRMKLYETFMPYLIHRNPVKKIEEKNEKNNK